MFNVLASVSSAGTNILTGCLGHQYRGDFIYIFLFPYPLSINWRIILSQAATVSCLDALMSLSYITLLQVCLKHVNCTHWHQTQEITEIALVCQTLFQASVFAAAAHLDTVTAPWLTCEPASQLSLPLLPMPLLPPTITHLGQDISPPPVLFMKINEAHSAFPIPLSHHHARCFPLPSYSHCQDQS